LDFHVELLDVDNGTFPSRVSTVHEGRAVAISSLADKNTGIKAKMSTLLDNTIDRAGVSKITRSIAAYALPEYILAVLVPDDNTILAPGQSTDIRLSIDGTKVPRGASQFYAEIHCDDPDYFLDSAYMDYGEFAADPTVLLTIVGGCLYETTTLYFGETGENQQPVWNSTKIMDADGADDGFIIDGNTAYLFGSDGLVYCNGPERVAMFARDGYGNQTWEGVLPDPLPTCDFVREDNAVLAQMSNTGILPYDNVLGTILNYAYVDSIEDHRVYDIDYEVDPPETLGVNWEWDAEYSSGLNLPYSNELTEGWAFKAYVTEYAVTDVVGAKYAFDDFWNFTISRHSLFSRYGYAIPSLYVGMIADWDVDDYGENISDYNEEFSVGWIFDPTTAPYPDYGGGVIKIPFGPGYTSLINTVDATTGWWSGQEPGFDSIYVWMSRPSTQFMNYAPFPVDDKRMWNTIVELNLPEWAYTGDEEDPAPPEAFDTYGYAFFGKFTGHDASALDNYSDMATLVNKFCGFGRGDVDNDGAINLVDIVYLNNFMFGSTPLGPVPFMHLGDVDGIGGVQIADITYLIDWYFNGGPAPVGEWALQQFATP